MNTLLQTFWYIGYGSNESISFLCFQYSKALYSHPVFHRKCDWMFNSWNRFRLFCLLLLILLYVRTFEIHFTSNVFNAIFCLDCHMNPNAIRHYETTATTKNKWEKGIKKKIENSANFCDDTIGLVSLWKGIIVDSFTDNL